jgi:hypothetical protein
MGRNLLGSCREPRCKRVWRPARTGHRSVASQRPEPESLDPSPGKSEIAAVARLLEADPIAAARFHSAGGPGAAGWLLIPKRPAHYFRDEQFSVAVRLRLGLDVPCAQGICQHVKANGVVCGEVLDPKGLHAMTCPAGGWGIRRHDAACKCVAAHAESQGCSAEREVVLPLAAPTRPLARMDVVVHGRTSVDGQPTYLDITVVSPLTAEMVRTGGSARNPGAAAKAAAAHKRALYPNVPVVPFAVETFGRWGEDARAWALSLAPPPLMGRTEAIAGIYQDVSVAVQKANADAILAAAVRSRAGVAPSAHQAVAGAG